MTLKYALIHLAELVLVIVVLILRGISRHPLLLGGADCRVVLWVVKDVALFPRAEGLRIRRQQTYSRGLSVLEATVIDVLDPVGYVKVRGELWRAEIVGWPTTRRGRPENYSGRHPGDDTDSGKTVAASRWLLGL